MSQLSADERDLLREWAHIIGPVIANPDEEVRRLRESRRSGGGFGRNYDVTGNRLTGTWACYDVVDRFATGPHAGQPSRLRFDPPHREVSITLTRLHRWADALPTELRERARAAWATRTRDLPALTEIALEAIDTHAQSELEAARTEWFTVLPCNQPPALSPHCAQDTHVGCWHGHARPSYLSVRHTEARHRHGPRGHVATFARGWSRYTDNTSARIVTPGDHYTCECACHTDGYAGQQLDLFAQAH
ncbi:hypothetical protein [uncultured Gordonia sp.]|uniref:hypothetical protein n=1 Tax=uncultured Gordonia sp. TaxID=198437 RepID=UPI0025921EDA|nr:hypothetical protein [uncultured Gordonia sp.]